MALRFNNTEITRVYFNGKEENTLEYNGKRYFGKRFELTKKESHGVTLTVKRTSSPNQQAGTGEISAGNGIYYGDVITIEIKAEAGYQEGKRSGGAPIAVYIYGNGECKLLRKSGKELGNGMVWLKYGDEYGGIYGTRSGYIGGNLAVDGNCDFWEMADQPTDRWSNGGGDI